VFRGETGVGRKVEKGRRQVEGDDTRNNISYLDQGERADFSHYDSRRDHTRILHLDQTPGAMENEKGKRVGGREREMEEPSFFEKGLQMLQDPYPPLVDDLRDGGEEGGSRLAQS